MEWIVRGEGKAFLSFGSKPRRVIPLVRFQLQPPTPEFRRPSLAGEWVFVDLAHDLTFVALRFTHREEGAFGQFTAAADDRQVQVRCLQFHECEVVLDTANYPLRRADLTPDRLSGSGLWALEYAKRRCCKRRLKTRVEERGSAQRKLLHKT